MRISDWSSDVCSSDLVERFRRRFGSKAVLGRNVLTAMRDREGPAPLLQACRYPSSEALPESNHTGAPAYISCSSALINARYGESSLRRWPRITGEVACSSSIIRYCRSARSRMAAQRSDERRLGQEGGS